MSTPPEDRQGERAEERNAELRQLFFDSSQELLQALNDQAMQLEKSPAQRETLRGLRRTVHTLKGDAAACGYRELSELAHELEDVLSLESAAAARSVPEIALRAADAFALMLEGYAHGKPLPDTKSVRAAIAELAGQIGSAENATQKRTQVARAHNWTEYERLTISQALQQGKRVYRVSVQIDPQCGMPIAARQMISSALAAAGEILVSQVADQNLGPSQWLEFALNSELTAKQLRQRCQIPTIAGNVRVANLKPKFKGAIPSGQSNPIQNSPSAGESQQASHGSQGQPRPAVPSAKPAQTDGAAANSRNNLLRVDAEKIESVMNLVGELILAKSMLQQTYGDFANRFPKDTLRGKFSDAMAFHARVLNDLQRSVMKIRMVPVDQLFRRFPRVLRDVARQCGKEVDIVINGEDTDLDKSILDAIAEPLTHLVRNAVGHGIESSEERLRMGKPRGGTLQLNAFHQGNHVVIEVSDDGHGIDAAKIRQRAVSQGVVTREQAEGLSEIETLNLIFRPGFSTAKEITELSGRGVGLDVVQSVVNRLKGTVQIETTVGKGATFRLRLPLTLAIIKALLFQVEQRLYAIPLNTVVEIARARKEEFCRVEKCEVLQLRNEVLPLLRLGRPRMQSEDAGNGKVFVLVINTDDKKFGLVVDELEGEDELVIKALDDHSISTELVSGASILGNGRVVLVLNLSALVERYIRLKSSGETESQGLLWAAANLPLQAKAAGGLA